jgi:hypothetical protein
LILNKINSYFDWQLHTELKLLCKFYYKYSIYLCRICFSLKIANLFLIIFSKLDSMKALYEHNIFTLRFRIGNFVYSAYLTFLFLSLFILILISNYSYWKILSANILFIIKINIYNVTTSTRLVIVKSIMRKIWIFI